MAQLTNPAATGGAGTHFEHRVGAFYLGLLLSRGVPPFLPTCVVKEVHLQSGHADYKTDDLLVVGQDWNGEAHRLITQVKRSFTLSANDEVCVDTFTRAWEDFQAPARFTPSHDVIALIVGSVSGKLWNGLRNLLDCAEAALEAMTALRISEGSFGHAKTSSDSPAQTASAFWEAIEEADGLLMPHEFSL